MKNRKNRIPDRIDDFLREHVESLYNKLSYNGKSIFETRIFLMCISLFISLLLWVSVVLDNDAESSRTMTANIKYINVPNGYVFYAPSKSVKLKISGRVNSLSDLQEGDITAEVDLNGLQPGRYNLPIKLDVPSAISIRSWTPSVADVEIYRHVERMFKITANVTGEPAPEKSVDSVELDVTDALISGPEANVLAVEAVEAEIPADKLNENGQAVAALKAKTGTGFLDADAMAKLRMTMVPGHVTASVKFEDETAEKKIPVRVSLLGEPKSGLKVESVKIMPDYVSVTGKSNIIKNIEALALSPVDISGLEENLRIMVPMRPAEEIPGVEISGSDKARIEITLARKVGLKTYSNVPVSVIGNKKGEEWKTIPVNVSVEGHQEVIDSLAGDNKPPFELYVDVTDIVSDNAELPVLVRGIAKDIEIVRIEPEHITVKSGK